MPASSRASRARCRRPRGAGGGGTRGRAARARRGAARQRRVRRGGAGRGSPSGVRRRPATRVSLVRAGRRSRLSALATSTMWSAQRRARRLHAVHVVDLVDEVVVARLELFEVVREAQGADVVVARPGRCRAGPGPRRGRAVDRGRRAPSAAVSSAANAAASTPVRDGTTTKDRRAAVRGRPLRGSACARGRSGPPRARPAGTAQRAPRRRHGEPDQLACRARRTPSGRGSPSTSDISPTSSPATDLADSSTSTARPPAGGAQRPWPRGRRRHPASPSANSVAPAGSCTHRTSLDRREGLRIEHPERWLKCAISCVRRSRSGARRASSSAPPGGRPGAGRRPSRGMTTTSAAVSDRTVAERRSPASTPISPTTAPAASVRHAVRRPLQRAPPRGPRSRTTKASSAGSPCSTSTSPASSAAASASSTIGSKAAGPTPGRSSLREGLRDILRPLAAPPSIRTVGPAWHRRPWPSASGHLGTAERAGRGSHAFVTDRLALFDGMVCGGHGLQGREREPRATVHTVPGTRSIAAAIAKVPSPWWMWRTLDVWGYGRPRSPARRSRHRSPRRR